LAERATLLVCGLCLGTAWAAEEPTDAEAMSDVEFIEYLGRPTSGKELPFFLLSIQENIPHPPGTPLDDFHRRCDDGSVLHFAIWFHPNPKPFTGVLDRPEREEWLQIIMGPA